MRSFFVVLLMLSSSLWAAQECAVPDAGQVLHARYDVYRGDQRYSVDYFHDDEQVAWRRGQVISLWSRSGDQASLLRVFPQYQRTIWYPAGDLRALGKGADWRGVAGWQLPQENGYSSTGEGVAVVQGCEARAFGNVAGSKVLWLAEAGLPARVEGLSGVVWQLVSLETVSRAESFGRWEQWQSTDFADVGDNEADPFLRRMIALGFVEHGASGFYQADGSPLEGRDSHHAH